MVTCILMCLQKLCVLFLPLSLKLIHRGSDVRWVQRGLSKPPSWVWRKCSWMCVCKIGPISARTVSIRLQSEIVCSVLAIKFETNPRGLRCSVGATGVVQTSLMGLEKMFVDVCLQNWTNFCPYGLNSTPIST